MPMYCCDKVESPPAGRATTNKGMDKFWRAVVVALIGLAGAIIAALVTRAAAEAPAPAPQVVVMIDNSRAVEAERGRLRREVPTPATPLPHVAEDGGLRAQLKIAEAERDRL